MKYSEALERLSHSKFRSRFTLSEEDLKHIERIGINKIREHAADFIRTRLAPASLEGTGLTDGRQTPVRGHPVFKAQHATATCCRGCLEKWYKIQAGRALSQSEQDGIVNLIMFWIKAQLR